ncbi:hypothetical protein HY734_00895 [Candidatus Uhrbacteria bacterium]|nr:hypothetical protein [Candidatus Uhrbacteria bacterium]
MDEPLQLKMGAMEEAASSLLSHAVKTFQHEQGCAFFILSVASDVPQAEDLANGMRDILFRRLEEFTSTLSLSSSDELQHAFETFLHVLNEELAISAREQVWDASPSSWDVHALIGLAFDRSLCFSGMGELTALFLHKLPNDRYHVFNLFRGIQTEQGIPSWDKPFAVVLNGELHPGDVFCASNRPLQQEVSPEELHHILTALPAQGAAAQVRHALSPEADTVVLVLQVRASHPSSPPSPPRTSAESSLRQLTSTQAKTDRILSDPLPGFPLSFLRGVFQTVRGHGRASSSWRGSWLPALRRVIQTLSRIGVSLFTVLTHTVRHARHTPWQETKEQVADRAHALRRSVSRTFLRLPLLSRYLLLAAVVGIIALSASIGALSRSHGRQAIQSAFEEAVHGVEEERDRASGALIYQDETQARTSVQEAMRLLGEVAAPSPDVQPRLDALRRELEGMLDQMRHVVQIPQPSLLADASVVGNGFVPQAIASLPSGIFLFGNDRSAYRLDPQAKLLRRVEGAGETGGAVKEAFSQGTAAYVLDDRPGVSSLLADDPVRVQSASLTLPVGDAATWRDLYAYGDRLYALQAGGEGQTSQVFRFQSRGGADFGAPAAWIRTRQTDLSDAVSLSVDGTVFILKGDGRIVRFTAGTESVWTQGAVEPPLASATDLWTDADSRFLYLLDPAEQRLVVFEKETGAFVVQYRSDAFVGLTDLVVDEASRSVYLLAGPKLYRIDATHLAAP